MRRLTILIALLLAGPLALTPGTARAQVEFLRSGDIGGALLLNFYGGYEGAISNRSDPRQAAVQCYNNSLARKAVFAGAAVTAINYRAGGGNDWQYARLVAAAIRRDGTWVQGDTTAWFVVDDTHWGALPAAGVFLPRDGQPYTPMLGVEYVDATYRQLGAILLGAQSGASMMSLSIPPYGDYWVAGRTGDGQAYACG
jgi:hypothetical protein